MAIALLQESVIQDAELKSDFLAFDFWKLEVEFLIWIGSISTLVTCLGVALINFYLKLHFQKVVVELHVEAEQNFKSFTLNAAKLKAQLQVSVATTP